MTSTTNLSAVPSAVEVSLGSLAVAGHGGADVALQIVPAESSKGESLLAERKNGLGFAEIGTGYVPVAPATRYRVTVLLRTEAWNYGSFLSLNVYEYSQPAAKAPEARHTSPDEFAVLLPCRPDETIPRYASFTTAAETKAIRAVLVWQGNPAAISVHRLTVAPAAPEGRPLIPPPEDPLLPRETMLQRLAARPNAEARLKRVGSRLTIALNGKPVVPIIHETYTPDVPYSLFDQAGVKFQVVPLTLGPYSWGEKGINIRPGMWTGPGEYDFTAGDEKCERVLRAAPDTCLVAGLVLLPYQSWGERYPDEVAQNEKGERAVVRFCHYYASRNTIEDREKEFFGHSLFSDVYRREMAAASEAWLAHARTMPYYKALVGVALFGGHDGQWGNWGYGANAADYSPAGTAAFRRWLTEKYGSDDALRAAWGRPDAALATASVPSIQSRAGADPFLDPVRDRPAMDYFTFDSDEKCRTLTILGEAIKRAAGKPVVCLSYYEDAFYGRRNNHWYEARRRRSPALDIFASPLDYGPFRRPGWVGGIGGCLSSLRLHNKLFLTELDLRTETSAAGDAEYDYNVTGHLNTPQDFNSVNRRETGLATAYGMSVWYYSLANGFHAPYAITGVKESVGIADWALRHRSKRFQPEVAVFADEASGAAVGLYAADSIHFPSTSRERSALFLSGVPFDLYAMDDLMERRLPDYKVYVFLNAYLVDSEQRRFIDRRLKRRGKTLVWMHAAGYLDERTRDPANVSRLVGMTIRKAEGSHALATQTVADPPDGFRNLLPCQGGDLPPQSGVKFYVDDAAAMPLAHYAAGGETAIAIRRLKNWTSVYIGRPGGLGPDMLHAIARDAGAFTLLSAPGNVAATDGNLLVLHGVAGGRIEARLPDEARVQDLVTGAELADGTSMLTLDLPVQETRVLGLVEP
ncbi:MAG: hypothetical protein PHR35_08880 [Kiritimatiellae bacterium]|nr:hypothetical protein [Kiritimatiellia bacterium]